MKNIGRMTIQKPNTQLPARALAFAALLIYGQFVSPLPRRVLENSVPLVTIFGTLLFVAGRKSPYLELLWGIEAAFISAGDNFGLGLEQCNGSPLTRAPA